jgi:ATPase family associated with various cellular activities (AAA)
MFSKKYDSDEIYINDDHKFRYITVPDYKYAAFSNKLKTRKHLYAHDDNSYAPNYTVKLYTKKYLVKSQPYDVRGKFLEFFTDYRGNAKLKELNLTRKDGFALDEYKNIDTYLLNFIKNKENYESHDLLHKAGLLFYGPPGNGKTSYIRYLKLNSVLPENTIFIWCKALPNTEFLNELEKIDALKIFIFEEITTTLRGGIRLDEFLQFCDGETTIPNSVIFCMTNHPELLPENLTNRPSRFNKIIEFKNPGKRAREIILKVFFKDKFQNEMVDQTDGLSLDQIKESFVINLTDGIPFNKAIDFVKKHKQTVKDSFGEYKPMGIKMGFDEDED